MGADGSEAARAALMERRRRVIDNYEDQLIDKAERDAKLSTIGDELRAGRVDNAAGRHSGNRLVVAAAPAQ